MPITDMKLHRPDGAIMPTDEHGKLTEIEDLRTVLHELVRDMSQMMDMRLPVIGVTMFDLLSMSDLLRTLMLREALVIIHGAVCPHLDSNGEPMSVEEDPAVMSQNLMQEIINILDKKAEQNEGE